MKAPRNVNWLVVDLSRTEHEHVAAPSACNKRKMCPDCPPCCRPICRENLSVSWTGHGLPRCDKFYSGIPIKHLHRGRLVVKLRWSGHAAGDRPTCLCLLQFLHQASSSNWHASSGMTLVGFLPGRRFVIYSGPSRISDIKCNRC